MLKRDCVNELTPEPGDFNILLSNFLFLVYLLEKYRFIIFNSEFLDRFCSRQFDINILKSFPRIYLSDEYRFVRLTVPWVLYFFIKLFLLNSYLNIDITELTVLW